MLDKNQSCITKDEYLPSYQEDSGITGVEQNYIYFF